MKKNKKNSLLWQITPPGGGPSSWVFGTMHIRDLRAFSWFDRAVEKMNECEIFATEFAFDELDPQLMDSAVALPEGQTLKTLLTPGVWKQLTFFCKKHLPVSAEVFENQHPMAVASTIAQTMTSEDMPLSLDETLWQKAKAAGKTCTGIETFGEQVEIVGNIPLDTHLKNLTWTLKNLRRLRRQLKKMTEWYQRGDIQQLYQTAKRQAKGMRRILVYERNALMANRLAEMVAERSVFFAVGAGHLAGQKGLLRLLKKSGFTVKPFAG